MITFPQINRLDFHIDGGLMVTATQLSRLDAKLGALVAAIDTDSKPITVTVFSGETRASALQRHRGAAARPRRPAGVVRVPKRETRRCARDVRGPRSRRTARCDRPHRGQRPWQADRRAGAGQMHTSRMPRTTVPTIPAPAIHRAATPAWTVPSGLPAQGFGYQPTSIHARLFAVLFVREISF
jgi:hypothetical protein